MTPSALPAAHICDGWSARPRAQDSYIFRAPCDRFPPGLLPLTPGPYLRQLEELRLDGNLMLHPLALPLALLERRHLRRLVLPRYWRLVGGAPEGLPAALLSLMPWLQLEHC